MEPELSLFSVVSPFLFILSRKFVTVGGMLSLPIVNFKVVEETLFGLYDTLKSTMINQFGFNSLLTHRAKWSLITGPTIIK